MAAEVSQCHPRGCAYPGRITDASMLPASDSPLAPAAVAAEADQCHPRGCAYPGRITDSDMLPAADQAPEVLNMGRGSSVQNFCAQGQASSGHASSSWQRGQSCGESVVKEVIEVENRQGGVTRIDVFSTQSGTEYHSIHTPNVGSGQHRKSSPRTPTEKVRSFAPHDLEARRRMVRDDSWIANMGSAVGSNQSDTWSPQRKLLEAEIEKLRETNKNQRVELTQLLQQQGRLEATAEQERMALECI